MSLCLSITWHPRIGPSERLESDLKISVNDNKKLNPEQQTTSAERGCSLKLFLQSISQKKMIKFIQKCVKHPGRFSASSHPKQ